MRSIYRSICRSIALGARGLILKWVGRIAAASLSLPAGAQEFTSWVRGDGQAYAQVDASGVVPADADPGSVFAGAGPEGIDTTGLPGSAGDFAPPQLLNWLEAQAANAQDDLPLAWSTWAEGAPADFIRLSVAEDGRVVFETPALGQPGALRGTATQAVVPAGTLRPGKGYVARLFFLKLTAQGEAGEVLGAFGEIEFKVRTTAPGGVIEFTASDLRVNEGDGTADIHVVRRGEALPKVSIEVNVAGGDATAGADFTLGSTTLVFEPGVTELRWTVSLVNDRDVELPEEAVFVLGHPLGGAAVGAVAAMSLRISDDDDCHYALEPPRGVLGPAEAVDSFAVTTAAGCRWTATANRDWIVLLNEARGDGPGVVVFGVNPNPGTQPRSGRITVAGVNFSIRQSGTESNAPAVTITWPPPGFRTTNSGVWLRGMAQDDFAVAETQWRLENATGATAYRSLPGGTQVVVRVERLLPGENTLRVRSRDAAGNWSSEVTRRLTHVVPAPLTLAVSGEGSVPAPSLDLSRLEVGRAYTLTAAAAKGHLFSNWTGSAVSHRARLTFTMESNFTLQANFVPNPFLPHQGNYAGLIHAPDAPRPESSGGFTLTLGARGAYSAVVRFAGERYSGAGAFRLTGRAVQEITRPGTHSLRIEWELDFAGAGERITGRVQDGDQVSLLLGDRAVFHATENPAPFQGRYTLLLPGGTDSAVAPGGDGYGTVRVTPGGRVEWTGRLPDGAALGQIVPVSRDGHWPLYVPLYRGAGCLLGWVNFSATETNDVAGLLTWSRPGRPDRRRYPEGFTNDLFASGVRYSPPTNAPPLGFARASVRLTGGSLVEPFESKIRLLSPWKVLNVDTHPVVVAMNPASGQFSGFVTPPGSDQPLRFAGVVFQGWDFGAGLFFETNQIGRVTLQRRN